MLTEATMKSRPRFVVFFTSIAIVIGIFYFVAPQFTSADPRKAAIQQAQKLIDGGHYRKAVEDLATAARRWPQDADIRYHLAFAYQNLNDWKDAEDQYNAALTINPYHPAALYQTGFYYARAGQAGTAQQRLARLDALCASGYACAERNLLFTEIGRVAEQERIKQQHVPGKP